MQTHGLFGALAGAMSAARQGQRAGEVERLEREERAQRSGWEHEDRLQRRKMDLLLSRLRSSQLANEEARARDRVDDEANDAPRTDRGRLAARVQALIAAGATPESANQRARLEFGFLPPRAKAPTPPGIPASDPRRTLSVHERRAREAIAAARAARRAVPAERPMQHAPGTVGASSYEDRVRTFLTDSTQAARHAHALEADADRLVQARDSVRAEAIGEAPARRGAAVTAAPDTLTAGEAEALYREAAESFQDAIARGADRATAQAAYNRIVAGIARRAGLLR